jgi:hypothetical protein
MDERERRGRNRVPDDPVTPGESATTHYAPKTVLMGIGEARRIVRGVRISNKTQDALESLERARSALDEFIRREDWNDR